MPATTISNDIATHLAAELTAALSGTYTLGSNIFASPEVPFAQGDTRPAIFVHASSGPGRTLARGSTGDLQVRRINVQAVVRGAHNNYAATESLAVSVRDVANYNVPSGYTEFRAADPHPIYLGRDSKGHFGFSVNFTVFLEE